MNRQEDVWDESVEDQLNGFDLDDDIVDYICKYFVLRKNAVCTPNRWGRR